MTPQPQESNPTAVSETTANAIVAVETPSVDVDANPKPAAVETKPSGPSTVLWLTRGDELFIAIVLGLTLVWMGVEYVQSRWVGRVLSIDHVVATEPRHLVDLNSADWIELSTLDSIGPALARRIVSDRGERGPFRSVDDLVRVKGIGKKTLEKLRPFVVARQTNAADATPGNANPNKTRQQTASQGSQSKR